MQPEISVKPLGNMDNRIKYSGTGCFFLAFLCLVIPINWLTAAVAAALWHEICHIIAVKLTGGRILSISIQSEGAILDTAPMEPFQELFCVLAGPAGSLSLLLFAQWVPRTALCGMVQGLFNMIPVYPLDGGRALLCLTSLLFPGKTGEKICIFVKWTVTLLTAAVAVWATGIRKMGFLPIIAAVFFLSRVYERKIPCKEGEHRVQ